MDDPHLPAIGTRFSLGSFRGTVRYVGQVPPESGLWLGVEWDDANRGKHSGIRHGVCYFTCRVANAGSFIRPSSKLSFGSSFLQALRSKYGVDVQQSSPSKDTAEVKRYTRRNLADIEVEAPNMEGVIQRASQLHKLREVGLGGWKREATDPQSDPLVRDHYAEVAQAFDSHAGEREGVISQTCPSIRGLDLSRSLLPTWLELSRISVELPQLQSLLLHFNRFADLSPSNMPLPNAFSQLSDLRIDGTTIQWDQILALSEFFPKLESLQMGSNEIERLGGLQASAARLCNLQLLNLEGNRLSDWEDITTSLQACPNLQRLILSNNKVKEVKRTRCSGAKGIHLKHVSLWDNPISSWSSLDALDEYVEGLQSLVLGGDECDLTRGKSMQDVRPIIIGRLGNLQTFNNAPIRAIERRDAELFYLSSIVKQDESGQKDKHPRWSWLIQLHGKPVEEKKNENSGTLRSKLLTITVHLSVQPPTLTPPYVIPAPAPFTVTSAQFNLLMTTPLRLLMSKLARFFSLKKGSRSIRSVWALLNPNMDAEQSTATQIRSEMRPNDSASDERITYEMDNLERDLQGYNFSKGDEIVLVLADP